MADKLLELDGIVKDFPGTRALDHVKLKFTPSSEKMAPENPL